MRTLPEKYTNLHREGREPPSDEGAQYPRKSCGPSQEGRDLSEDGVEASEDCARLPDRCRRSDGETTDRCSSRRWCACAADDDPDQLEVVVVANFDRTVALVAAEKADMSVPHVELLDVFIGAEAADDHLS